MKKKKFLKVHLNFFFPNFKTFKLFFLILRHLKILKKNVLKIKKTTSLPTRQKGLKSFFF